MFAGISLGQRALPNPVLKYAGQENYQANGKDWTKYRFTVWNSSAYPAELFAAAPELLPCGLNTRSSRTWVDFYDRDGKRLYGFCALSKPADLNTIWFAVAAGTAPPAKVYIELNDRKTRTKYKSNLAKTAR
jgi:hypothetical protein